MLTHGETSRHADAFDIDWRYGGGRVRLPVLGGELDEVLARGEIEDVALIRRASDLAIAAGSDFIKTSTGKVAVNATLDAAGIMLTAIRDSGKLVGFKPAGGVRTVGDARDYLALAASILGEGWATPKTFRFGASGLLGDILSVLGGQPAPSAPASY